jgi:bacteriocin biosynthesis cyclodehydratase domain-containing protein
LVESEKSPLYLFYDKELEYLGRQISFFDQLYTEKVEQPFSQFSDKGLEAQTKLKNSNVLVIVNDPDYYYNVLAVLQKIGVGKISTIKKFSQNNNYYHNSFSVIDEYELKEEEDILKKLESIGYDSDLIIYLSSTFDDKELIIEANSFCKQNSIAFLPYVEKPDHISIGPLFMANMSACYQCYESRKKGIRENKVNFTNNKKENYDNAHFSNSPKLNIDIGLEFLSLEVIKYFTDNYIPKTIDCVWTFDFITSDAKISTVLRLPRCSLCGVNRIFPKEKIWEKL